MINRREFIKLLGLIPLLSIPQSVVPRLSAPYSSNKPNIIIIVFDTLSAKHVSLYGYDRKTMPNLARFAQQATVFHKHYAAGNFTVPGTASIFTGTYPWTHRAMHLLAGTMKAEFVQKNMFALFAQAGYAQIAFSQNVFVTMLLSQIQQYLDSWMFPDEYKLAWRSLSDKLFLNDYAFSEPTESIMTTPYPLGRPGALYSFWPLQALKEHNIRKVLLAHQDEFPRGLPANGEYLFRFDDSIDLSLAQIRSLPRPFLAYHHMLPPHQPYTPSREFIGIFDQDQKKMPNKPLHHFGEAEHDQSVMAYKRKDYDEYIAYSDQQLGRLLDSLKLDGRFEDSIIVFTSDHGEMFERGIWEHNNETLYEPIIRVPMLIHVPGQNYQIDVHQNTSNIDLLPTLLHLCERSIPDWIEGQVLPPWKNIELNRPVFALEAKSNPKYGLLTNYTIAMIKENHKLIHYRGYDGFDDVYEYYDLSKDPDELDNRSARSVFAREMEKELNALIQKINQS